MALNPLDRATPAEEAMLRQYGDMLLQMNRHINLISREDEDAVFEHHILHCLSLAMKAFPAGSVVVDWGSGGGLPAIPLAVMFPEVLFVAVDAVAKKMQAVRAMARRLGLANVVAWHGRAEEYDGRADYSVSRAAAPLAVLWAWHQRVAASSSADTIDAGLWQRGLLCLKGGDLSAEKAEMPPNVRIEEIRLDSFLKDRYFAEKVILACTA